MFAGEGPYRLPLPAAAAFATAYRKSPRLRAVVASLDLRIVLAAQLWRVNGIAFLFALVFGQLPATFAVPAGIGDLATGIAAFACLLALGNGILTRRRLYAFTTLGLTDFAVAAATGLAFEPAALNQLPFVLFPTVAARYHPASDHRPSSPARLVPTHDPIPARPPTRLKHDGKTCRREPRRSGTVQRNGFDRQRRGG